MKVIVRARVAGSEHAPPALLPVYRRKRVGQPHLREPAEHGVKKEVTQDATVCQHLKRNLVSVHACQVLERLPGGCLATSQENTPWRTLRAFSSSAGTADSRSKPAAASAACSRL
jgi:hypothetical protein